MLQPEQVAGLRKEQAIALIEELQHIQGRNSLIVVLSIRRTKL